MTTQAADNSRSGFRNFTKPTKRSTIEERLEKLERELVGARRRNRRLLVTVGLSIAVCAVGITVFFPSFVKAQPAASVAKEIRANSFLLLDENGKVRSRLSLRDDGPALVFSDEKGRARASLAADKDTTYLGLRDANGKLRAGQIVYKDAAVISLPDENGILRCSLSIGKEGPTLHLYNERRNLIWSAP